MVGIVIANVFVENTQNTTQRYKQNSFLNEGKDMMTK